MNTERIQELAEQAKAESNQWLGSKPAITVTHDELEKFAELIVRECIQVVGLEDSDTEEWFKAKADSVEKIKQHFGVEQ